MTVINKIGIVIVGALLLVGCSSSSRSKVGAEGALVTVNGESLSEDDLRKAMPIGLHGEDSVRFADAYIRNWVEDAVLFMQAEDNIPGDVKIDELVASYRRSLIMHVYQEELVRQKLDENLSEEDMQIILFIWTICSHRPRFTQIRFTIVKEQRFSAADGKIPL